MEFGLIQVTPRGSRAACGLIGADGRFTLGTFELDDGCVPGEHSVAVDGRKSLGASRIKWHAPPRFAFPGTSELSINVDQPLDDVLIEIHTGSKKPFQPYIEVLSQGGKGEDTRSGDTVF